MVGGKHPLMPGKCPEGPAICPAAGGGAGGFRSRAHRGEAVELADQVPILHHRPVWVSAEVSENPATHGKALTTVGRS